jgi:hypothetical protein
MPSEARRAAKIVVAREEKIAGQNFVECVVQLAKRKKFCGASVFWRRFACASIASVHSN